MPNSRLCFDFFFNYCIYRSNTKTVAKVSELKLNFPQLLITEPSENTNTHRTAVRKTIYLFLLSEIVRNGKLDAMVQWPGLF